MLNFSKAIQMPDRSLLRIEQMARVSLFDHGVGVLDERGRMVNWIECADPGKRNTVASILLEAMNSPRRAKQPDWGFLADSDDAPQAAVPAEPQKHALVAPRRQSAAETREPSAALLSSAQPSSDPAAMTGSAPTAEAATTPTPTPTPTVAGSTSAGLKSGSGKS